MADDKSKDLKVVICIADTEDLPFDGLEMQIFLDKQLVTKIKPTKQDKNKFVWEADAFSQNLSGEVSQLIFKAASSGFMKKKSYGQAVIEISELKEGVPCDSFLPLLSVKNSEKEAGAKVRVQAIKLPRYLVWHRRDFWIPIHSLLDHDLIAPLSTLLKEKKYPFDWEKQNGKHMAALHYAVVKQEPGLIPLLLSAGASVDQKLTTKKYKPHQEMRGMHVADCSALHLACFLPSGKVVSELLEGKANTATKMATYTPLHVASSFNNIGPVTELLKFGADPNAEDGMGNTPLHLAAVHGANDVIRPLIEGGVDIWKTNSNGKGMGEMIGTQESPLSTQLAIIEAAECLDHREFLLKKTMPKADTVHLDGTLKDKWADCPQFGLKCKEGVDEAVVFIMIHQSHDHTNTNQMKNVGFMLLTSPQCRFRLPTYKMGLLDYGKTDPFKLKIKKGENFVVSPYVKLVGGVGSFNFIAMSDDPFEVVALQHWKYELSLPGEWGPDSAGGSIAEKKTWAKNPMYVLTLPQQEEKVDVFIHLEQAQEAADVQPYSIHPYKHHIGFYIYDMSLKEMLFRTDQFLNAQSIYSVFGLDTREATKFIIVPATHKAGEMTRFSLHISSEVEFKVAPVKKTFTEA